MVSSRYVHAAIQSEYESVISSTEGGRNNRLNRASFSIGTIVGAGAFSREEAETLLEQAAEQIGLEPSEIRATIKSGLDAGIKKPRESLIDVDGGGYVPPPAVQGPPRAPEACEAIPLPDHRRDAHLEAVSRMEKAPVAARLKGFELEACKKFLIAPSGNDALLGVTDPNGVLVAVKARSAQGEPRYKYTTPGHGAPAWCSQGFTEADTVFVGEGEFNAVAFHMTKPEWGAMGAAGTSGDLHLEALKGKRVYIFGDDDASGRKAQERWIDEAFYAGACEVWQLKQGQLDACDLLKKGVLAEELERWIVGAKRCQGGGEPLPEEAREKALPNQIKRDDGKVEQLDEAGMRDHVLEVWATQDTHVRYVAEWKNWYVYENGAYKLTLEEAIKARVEKILEAYGQRVSERKLSSVLAKLTRERPIFIEFGPKLFPHLNLKNGFLDMETASLIPHSPEHFSTAQTKTVFDINASCPKFMKFIERVCPDRKNRETLQEFLGYALSANTKLQKALYLQGEAGTGKGTLTTTVMAELLGGNNSRHSLVATMSLDTIRDGDHSLVNTVNKQLIIVSEAERNNSLIGFKKITGGDPMYINPKNKDGYNALIEAKIIITTNTDVFTGDDAGNSSIDRRLIILPFDVTQRSEDKNPNIGEELTTPEELSGVLLWCLAGYQRLKANSFKFSSDGDASKRLEFLSSSNTAIDFAQDRLTPIEGAEISSSELYEAYKDWAEGVDNGYGRKGGMGHKAGSQKKFSNKFQAAASALGWEVEKGRKTDRTNRLVVWKGVALRQS